MNGDAHEGKQYVILAGEVESAFPNLMRSLREGSRMIVVSDVEGIMADDINNQRLALLGSIVKICSIYQATVVFTPAKCSGLLMRRP